MCMVMRWSEIEPPADRSPLGVSKRFPSKWCITFITFILFACECKVTIVSVSLKWLPLSTDFSSCELNQPLLRSVALLSLEFYHSVVLTCLFGSGARHYSVTEVFVEWEFKSLTPACENQDKFQFGLTNRIYSRSYVIISCDGHIVVNIMVNRGQCSSHPHLCEDCLPSGSGDSLVRTKWFHPVYKRECKQASHLRNWLFCRRHTGPSRRSSMAFRVCARLFTDSAVLSRRIVVSVRQENPSWFVPSGQSWTRYSCLFLP